MILTIYDHESSVTVQVPVTPDSTFVDVLRCCKGFKNHKYYITAVFPNREEKAIETFERPYNFIKKNSTKKFVIYKEDNILLNGLSGHQDKKRFTFTDLANFASHHDIVVEKHNRAIHAMEERLRRLRKEDVMRKRGECNLLTLVQSANVNEEKISAIRKHSGHPLIQNPRRSQDSYLKELKVWFRAADDEMRRLDQRVDNSLQRIKAFRIYEPLECSERTKGVLRELNIQSFKGESIKLESFKDVNKLVQKSQESSDNIDLKIKDLRNRLNLNRKPGNASLRVAELCKFSQAIKNKSLSVDETRTKSAAGTPFKLNQSCPSIPPSSTTPKPSTANDFHPSSGFVKNSSDVSSNVSPHINNEIPDYKAGKVGNPEGQPFILLSKYTSVLPPQQLIIDKRRESEISCQENQSEGVFLGEKPSVLASETKRLCICPSATTIRPLLNVPKPAWSITSISHKRRQRLAYSKENSPTSVTEIVKISEENICSQPSVSSETACPAPVEPILKSCFYKVVQPPMTDNCTILESISHTSSEIVVPSTKHSKAIEAMKPCFFDSEELETKYVEISSILEIIEEVKCNLPVKSDENSLTAFTSNDEPSASTVQQAVVDSLNTSFDVLKENSAEEFLDFKQISSSDLNHSSSFDTPCSNANTSFSQDAHISSDSLIQVTPMSQDTLMDDSETFNITKDQDSFEFCDNKKASTCSNNCSQAPNISLNLPDLIDSSTVRVFKSPPNIEDSENSDTEKGDSMSVRSSSFANQELEADLSQHRGNDDPLSDMLNKYFTASPYPYPFTEVLEQLDGSASILRHCNGSIRSHRKCHSSNELHHHIDVPSQERRSFSCMTDAVQCKHSDRDVKSFVPDASGNGLLFEFKPKGLPDKFFGDLHLKSGANELSSTDVSAEKREENVISENEEAKNKSISFNISINPEEDTKTTQDISGTTFNKCSKDFEPENEEPKIIVAGGDVIVSEDETSGSENDSNFDSVDGENQEDETSFSPLIDTFCEKTGTDNVILPVFDLDKNHEGICAVAGSSSNSPSASGAPISLKGILKKPGVGKSNKESTRVVFSPLAILLDAALHGELDVIRDIVNKHGHSDMVNDEGITALHNAICAGHSDIVHFLVSSGCDVNAADSDLWTPLHCAASCYNISFVQLLIKNGACVFATTESDGETALDKCEDEEEDGGQCKRYLKEIQVEMMSTNVELYAAYDSQCSGNSDELHFLEGDIIVIIHPGKANMEGEDNQQDMGIGEGWCFARNRRTGEEGYAPKNYLSLFPRVAHSWEKKKN